MGTDQIQASADNLRATAKLAMHDGSEGAYDKIWAASNVIGLKDLSAVASSLERGNSFLGISETPQAKIERDSDGQVSAIEFHAGKLDFAGNRMSIRIGALSKELGYSDTYSVTRRNE